MVKRILPLVIAVILGILARVLIEPHGPDQEPWDNPIYWQLAYPAICIGCAVLGFFFSRNAWAYGFLAMGIQGLPAILANLDAELVGVSIILLAVLSVPPVLAGLLGSWLQRRYGSRSLSDGT